MGKTAKLNIVAPGREKLTEEVISLSTSESNGNIEFLANHAPIIVATVPTDRKSTRLNSSHIPLSRMPSSA